MKRYIYFFIIVLIFNYLSFSQTGERKFCGTTGVMQEALQNPEKQQILDQLEIFTQDFISNMNQNRTGGPYIIPVVVHVVHDYEEENISYEQIDNGILRINEDFQGLNDDVSEVIDSFTNIIGAPNIEFRLAKKDPEGNCTYGVTRTGSELTTSGSASKLQDLIAWDDKKYVNIWVVRSFEEGSSAAAFAYKPGSGPNMDGIFCLYNYFGDWNVNSDNGPTGSNWSRHTMPHEMGHFFNLDHPWGGSNSPGEDGNCSIDDGVEDTPPTIGTDGNLVGCPLNQATCDGSLDNVQNIMDYADCAHMFTQGQSDRMLAAANSLAGNRWYLWQSDNLLSTGTDDESFNDNTYADCAPIPDFRVAGDNSVGCSGSQIDFENFTYNYRDETITYLWEFDGGIPYTSSEESPSVQYENPGSYSVSLTACKEGNCNTILHENAITILSQMYVNIENGAGLSQGFESATFPNMASETWWVGPTYNEEHWSRTELASKDGASSFRIKSQEYGYTRQAHEFSTPELDLSDFTHSNSDPFSICFDIAYAKRLPYQAVAFDENGVVEQVFPSIHDDALIVSYKTTCDGSWIDRARVSTRLNGNEPIQKSLITEDSLIYFNSFVPMEEQWSQVCINAGGLAGASEGTIKFTFEGTGEDQFDLHWVDDGFSSAGELITASTIGGGWLYLDNIVLGNSSVVESGESSSRLLDINNLVVAPNPSSYNEAWISFETLEKTNVVISVSNLLGVNIGTQNFTLIEGQHTFQLSNLFNFPPNKGTFIVIVRGENTYQSELIIVK